jgi:sulfhydrogenase subunit beta (sulfur reductase)
MSYVLSERDLREWMDEMIAHDVELVAPVGAGGPLRFERIRSASEAVLDGSRTRWSPKEFVLPRNETLFRYDKQADGRTRLEESIPAAGRRVLFGLTPCDAAGLERLAAVFDKGQSDPYILSRREGTTVATFTCKEAGAECFCTAVGGSPGGEEGSDLHVTALEEDLFLVRPITEKGESLLENRAGSWRPAPDGAEEEAQEQVRRIEGSMNRARFPAAGARSLAERFDDDVWESLAATCLGCKICTTVCPSCSCFDVYDEGDAHCGRRCRCWDGCTQPLFTLHTTGHNPRSTQTSRFRQRVLHKFSYYPQEHGGSSMCVGCGRCALLCPAGLDVHQTVMRVLGRAQSSKETSDG